MFGLRSLACETYAWLENCGLQLCIVKLDLSYQAVEHCSHATLQGHDHSIVSGQLGLEGCDRLGYLGELRLERLTSSREGENLDVKLLFGNLSLETLAWEPVLRNFSLKTLPWEL